MKIAAKCTGATFSLGEDDKAEFFEEVDSFKYLGHVLHRADADWPAVLQIIGRARQVWGQLGKFMRRERADPIFSAKFYQAVFQAVQFLGGKQGFDGKNAAKTGWGTHCFLEAGGRDEGLKSGG